MEPTAGQLVLCGYRVYSAVRYFGFAEGAVMLRVERLDDVLPEFEVRMRELAKRDCSSLGVRHPSRWSMLWYLPYGGEPKSKRPESASHKAFRV